MAARLGFLSHVFLACFNNQSRVCNASLLYSSHNIIIIDFITLTATKDALRKLLQLRHLHVESNCCLYSGDTIEFIKFLVFISIELFLHVG